MSGSLKVVSEGTSASYDDASAKVDLSSYIAVGSTGAIIRAVNVSDSPLNFHFRKTGSSQDFVAYILEGRSSADLSIEFGATIDFEYYITSGSVDIWLIDYAAVATALSVYCTATQVKSFMGLPFSFDASSNPTLSEVNEIITRVCDEIDQFTHHAWRTTRVTNEYYTAPEWTPMVDGLGDWSDRSRIYMMHRKIHEPLVKLECFDGNNWVDFVANYIESRYGDYWLDYDRGIIHFANRYPLRRRHAVRLTYDYGESSVPADITNCAIMLAAYQLLQRDDRSVLLPEGTSNITPTDKAEKWYRRAYQILARRVDIISYQ